MTITGASALQKVASTCHSISEDGEVEDVATEFGNAAATQDVSAMTAATATKTDDGDNASITSGSSSSPSNFRNRRRSRRRAVSICSPLEETIMDFRKLAPLSTTEVAKVTVAFAGVATRRRPSR